MSPVSKKRKRPGPRRPARQHARTSLVDVALAEFANRIADAGPLQSELLLSQMLGVAWGRSEWGRTDAAEALALEVIDGNLMRHPAGGLLLSVIGAVGPEAVRERARLVRDAGLASGSSIWRMPQWVDQIGQVKLDRGVTVTDVFGDQTAYNLEYFYPGAAEPERHVLVVVVDHNMRLVGDMFVRIGPGLMDSLDSVGEQNDRVVVAETDPQVASDEIWRHLDMTDRTLGEPFGNESAETRYVAAARLAALPPPRQHGVDAPEVSSGERERIVTEFMKSAAVQDLLSGESTADTPPERDTVQFIARVAIDYACDYGAGDPLRWSPTSVELFLTDWASRKVHWEAEDVPWVPEVLDALVAHCGELKELDPGLIEQTREAVDEFGGDFLVREMEGTSKGPAAQVVASMLADGVDVTDQAAVQRWINTYNAAL